ncbi:MAG: hypothetical protein M3N07_02145 [Pseudomonadota bacterium]|nr:hypothetical protein [Pseudomonadota bacterium]
MKVEEGYHERGYAKVEGLVPEELARAFLHQMQVDLRQSGLTLRQFSASPKLLSKPAIEIHGSRYKPMNTFLWGMTPAMCQMTGLDLLPTYCFFRIYQAGDICRIHSDRPACEHSLSLTLAYGDGVPWDFQVGRTPLDQAKPFAESFGSEPYASVTMAPGDAVIYKGPRHRHGRITPNPNQWSAHMFLHWVDKNGPHASDAFESVGRIPEKIDFS